MREQTVAVWRSAAAAAWARIVVVVLALVVGVAVVIVAGHPVEGGLVVSTWLLHSRQRW